MLSAIPVEHTDVVNHGTWSRGTRVAQSGVRQCLYWRGRDDIYETPAWYYLLRTGLSGDGSAVVFSHYVYRVAKAALAGQDLQVLADELRGYALDPAGESLRPRAVPAG